ncbi:MAG: glycoside hydrolase family 92 protein [Clostridiales bacterium]|nr:glycoside hydrolase family 92 protein [Clostridiales bacterium]
MEYAYNDYCAAQLAKAMGDEENYQKWLARSHSWTNIWNPDVQNSGYSGFIWPKAADGSWMTDSRMQSPAAYQDSWSPYF